MLYDEKFSRNIPLLSVKQQAKARKTRFCIIGLGGTGGFALECLARLGAEWFIVFDHDRFELTNFNRQVLATDENLDMRKTDAAISRARSINEKIKIKKHSMFDSKSATIIAGCDVVLDCTDKLATKLLIAESCCSHSVPYIFCSAGGSRGIVSVFAGYPFEKAFQADDAKKSNCSCASVLCPAAALAGTLAASQALNLIIGKPVICAPNALFFDIFDRRIFWKAKLG